MGAFRTLLQEVNSSSEHKITNETGVSANILDQRNKSYRLETRSDKLYVTGNMGAFRTLLQEVNSSSEHKITNETEDPRTQSTFVEASYDIILLLPSVPAIGGVTPG